MLKGTVNFRARIKGNGLTFPLFEFNPNEPGVDKVDIEGSSGDEIRTAVHFSSVASQDDARTLATKVNTAALNRIAFYEGVAIENAQRTGEQFSPLNPKPGVIEVAAAEVVFASDASSLVVSISPAKVKSLLEQVSPPGERNFGLVRSARQSIGPVEEFMHLYNILLMIFNDKQSSVDVFIVSEDPAVRQTQHPHKKPGVMETVYTRLRNEFAHKRANVNLENTKAEMANRLSGLVALTKRAIEQNP